MLLSVDLREWMVGDAPTHSILEAVNLVGLEKFRNNERGCGSERFPPRMMLALLIYCYSHGIFGSRADRGGHASAPVGVLHGGQYASVG